MQELRNPGIDSLLEQAWRGLALRSDDRRAVHKVTNDLSMTFPQLCLASLTQLSEGLRLTD